MKTGAASFRSYSSPSRPPATLRSWVNLVQAHRFELEERVAQIIGELRETEALVLEHTGVALQDCSVLDIGPGQRLMQMAYFAALGNRVVGVDRDVIIQGFDPVGYWRMGRSNGLMRVAKTAGRKAIGIDRSYHKELSRQLGLPLDVGRLRLHQMNAWELEFPTGRFDFVFSFRVFMHLVEPSAALNEAARVLAPGGVAYMNLMPYGGPNGCLDIRTLGGRGHDLPPWAHMRPQHRHLVEESAYLNRIHLSEWRDLFTRAMPGCSLLLVQPDLEERTAAVERLWREGELLDFELDDLVTSDCTIIWRKPTE